MDILFNFATIRLNIIQQVFIALSLKARCVVLKQQAFLLSFCFDIGNHLSYARLSSV